MSAGPHPDLPASSSRSHQIVTATSSERALSCPSYAHTLSQVAMPPFAARGVIRAVRATGRRAWIAAVGRPPSVCCSTANQHDRRDGLRCLGIHLDFATLTFSRPRVGFGMFAFCSPCPCACSALPRARCQRRCRTNPRAAFSWHADDGRHSRCNTATGITVIDGRLILIRPCYGRDPGVPFSLHAAAACGLQPTSVSALSSRATGPHVWRHRSRPSPTARAAAGPDSACGPDIAGFQPENAGLSLEDCAGFYSQAPE